MDFVADALFDGRRFRALTVVDNFTKESLAIEVGQQLKGEDVVAVMERLRHQRDLPQRIQTDNGSEFISIALDRWAHDHGVTMDYSRPGKPPDNPFIESFNGSFRDECLNTQRCLSLDGARQKIGNWRVDYNHFRTHPDASGRIRTHPDAFRRSEMSRLPSSPPDSPPNPTPNFPVLLGPNTGRTSGAGKLYVHE